MFRRWPFFQRLLSWTKPYAPADRGTRDYERYDWNSLLGGEPICTRDPAGADGRDVVFPVATGDGAQPRRLRRARPGGRGTDAAGPRPAIEGADGDGFELETTDGVYRCQALVVAVGVAEPYTPPGNGMEHTIHYADVRPAESYAAVGCSSSATELRLRARHRAAPVGASAGPRVAPKVKLSVETRPLVGVRARYVQPYEDHVLGGGVSVLDARSIASSGGRARLTVRLRRTDGGADLSLEVDDVISATGFVAPLVDPPALGVQTVGQSRLPVQTPWWESTTLPGIFFAGTISQGAKGLQKHGVPSNSGGVHGARYNARVLAGRIARTHSPSSPSGPTSRPMRSRVSWRPSWPRPPSSSTSAATSPAC